MVEAYMVSFSYAYTYTADLNDVCKDLHGLYISCFNVFLYFCTYIIIV